VPNISLQQNELYQSSEADSDCTATQRRKAGSKSSIDSGVAKTSNKSDFSGKIFLLTINELDHNLLK